MWLKSPSITWLLQNALEASDRWQQWPDVKRQDPPRGPSEDTGISTWLPEFPSSCSKLRPLTTPPSTTEAFSDDHESSGPESASASRATSSNFTDWKFPLWIFSMLAPMSWGLQEPALQLERIKQMCKYAWLGTSLRNMKFLILRWFFGRKSKWLIFHLSHTQSTRMHT